MINLKRFVDINIKTHIASGVNSTRDTVVLYTAEGTLGTTHLITSLTEATTTYGSNPTTLAYLSMYFANGGVKCLVIEGTSYSNITAAMLKALDNKYICVCYAAASEDISNAYTAMKTLASTRASDTSVYGINEKILLANSTSLSDTTSVKNFGVKYTVANSEVSPAITPVIGAEMTIAAYLSQANVNSVNSIYDYAFTKEVIREEEISDDNFGTLMTNNYNVDLLLANSVRNCGGNLKDGKDLINEYVRIILHQTLTDVLVNLLTQKLKGNVGVSKIYSAISEEMSKYLNCGYLTTDKVWNDDDLVVVKNNVSYKIIEKGTPISNGYYITILPMTSLTTEEKAAHKSPAIYVIIADQYGIRQITINGEVI